MPAMTKTAAALAVILAAYFHAVPAPAAVPTEASASGAGVAGTGRAGDADGRRRNLAPGPQASAGGPVVPPPRMQKSFIKTLDDKVNVH